MAWRIMRCGFAKFRKIMERSEIIFWNLKIPKILDNSIGY
jgi:hypothetical protein